MKNRLWLYAGLVLAGIVVIAPLAGYAVGRVVAGRLGDGMIRALEESLGARVEARRVTVTALLQIVLEDARVLSADGEDALPLAEAGRVVIYPQLFNRAAGAKINGVLLDRPLLYLRVDEDGRLNIQQWLDAARDCDDLRAMRGFPNRIIVRNGSALIQQADGGGEKMILIEDIQGQAGKTVSSGVVVDFDGSGPAGEFTIKGDSSPCAGGGVNLNITSDRWDFDAFKLAVLRWMGGTATAADGLAADFHAGAGKLEARVFGGFDALRAEGKIRAGRYSARFSLSPGTLTITELSAKAEGGKIKGGGTVNFDSANLPLRMSFALEDVETIRLLRGLFGYQYAPRARLSGFLKMSGSLNALGAMRQTGGVEAADGEIRLPPIRLGSFGRYAPPVIPFESFRGRVVRDGGGTRLYDAALSAPGLSVTGRADFSGGLLNPGEGGSEGRFSASLAFDVADIGDLLNREAGRDLFGSGAAKGEVRVEGTAGRKKTLRGGGKIALSNGWFVNPYSDVVYSGGAGRLPFDNASAVFSFTENSLRLSECKLNAEGLHIDMSGEIGEGGALDFRGARGDVGRRGAEVRGVARGD